jgi:acyl dehydratase
MSVFYDDFTLGATFVSPDRTITESDIALFAGLSGDHSEIHMDAERAKAGPFGARIAHGALIFSISIGLTTQSGLLDGSLIAFYGVEGLRFTKPVFIGDTVAVRKRVAALDDKGPGRGLVTFDTRVLNQQAAVVLRYRDSLLVKKGA